MTLIIDFVNLKLPKIKFTKMEEKMDNVVSASTIQFADFVKLDIRTATIVEAHEIEKADKLLRLILDVGGNTKQIVAGIKPWYELQSLIGKQVVIVTNLEPRTLRGITSYGMLLAASDKEGNLSLLTTDKPMSNGVGVH